MVNLMFELYLTFFKIGALAFGGGYATIPLIERYVVNENGWLIMEEFIDLISISQMTPGPIAVNAATFVGQKVGGFIGAVVATLGVITPQFILMMFLGYFLFSKGKKFKALDWILNGIKAGVVSLILITAIELLQTSVFPNGISAFKLVPAITFVIGFILYVKKVDMLKIIGISAVCGLALNFII